MSVKHYRPYTPSRRNMTSSSFEEITKKTPEKSLLEVKKKNAGRNSYGRENYGAGSYGRRGVDSKYRGDEEMDRMMGEYGRYQENRSRYGAGEETDKSFHFMVKALEDFIKVLHEEVETPQQKQELMTALQNSMR